MKIDTSSDSHSLAKSERVFQDSPAAILDNAPDSSPTSPARFSWLTAIVFILVVYGLFSLGAWSQNHAPQPPLTGPYESKDAVPPTGKIIVHVTGAVKKPGVYTLPMEARIQDALQKAGGALPDGDPNQLNLAAWAEDGSRIEVPLKSQKTDVNIASETNEAPLVVTSKPPAEIDAKAEPSSNPKPSTATASRPATPDAKHQSKPVPTRKINLNKATVEELSLLPGVGPATAQKIVEQRQTNGPFSSVDDLDDIKGIGEKKLEKIRPYATVR